jgi:hypothetical protein
MKWQEVLSCEHGKGPISVKLRATRVRAAAVSSPQPILADLVLFSTRGRAQLVYPTGARRLCESTVDPDSSRSSPFPAYRL